MSLNVRMNMNTEVHNMYMRMHMNTKVNSTNIRTGTAMLME